MSGIWVKGEGFAGSDLRLIDFQGLPRGERGRGDGEGRRAERVECFVLNAYSGVEGLRGARLPSGKTPLLGVCDQRQGVIELRSRGERGPGLGCRV